MNLLDSLFRWESVAKKYADFLEAVVQGREWNQVAAVLPEIAEPEKEIKAAAAMLPALERSELITWLSESEDVCEIRREALIREIQDGIEQADRGELLDADEVFMRLRAAN